MGFFHRWKINREKRQEVKRLREETRKELERMATDFGLPRNATYTEIAREQYRWILEYTKELDRNYGTDLATYIKTIGEKTRAMLNNYDLSEDPSVSEASHQYIIALQKLHADASKLPKEFQGEFKIDLLNYFFSLPGVYFKILNIKHGTEYPTTLEDALAY
ncbi:hypothetical protein HY450_02655 [Candidatus Pacearchaeota archaeon]|nr:hypothetical protein [Candidatus Pacearchaeota archaeon]